VDEAALAVYNASCEKLEELRYSVEERSAELEIMLVEDGPPYDGEIWVDPAAFLDLGAVCLNELTEIVDVRPVREENVCCALVLHKAKEGSQWWKICGGTGSHTHQGQNFCGRHQLYYRTQEKTGKVPIFTTDTVASSSHYSLGIFHCLSEAHLVSHSARVGKAPGEVMTRAFILAKSSRSPLKQLKDRVIPTLGIGNDGRPPSPLLGEGDDDHDHGGGSASGWRGPPPTPRGGGTQNNGTGPDLDDSKEAENPEGNGGLPARTTPGAMEGVNFGDGSRVSKDARETSARRRREQERARKEAEAFKAPGPNDADSFHTALLTPLGDTMLKRLDSPAVVPAGL
jgi:hypothetical protein